MALNIVKLCVGASSIEDLEDWQARQRRVRRSRGEPDRPVCPTRMRPKRDAEVLDGGSLYWVINHLIVVRQRILALSTGVDIDGRSGCLIELDPELVRTESRPKRPFQGWRYLTAGDAPKDLPKGAAAGDVPAELVRKLHDAGVW